jgi:inosine-uridine nucleoside N-ribohydrolase
MNRQKIIIDTDPGIDDAMAIHYAFAHPHLEVMGLTTIFGNVFVEQATRNALFLTEQAKQHIPVSEGAKQPLRMPLNPPSHYVHGDEGFGKMPAPKPTGKPDPRPAHVFLSETIRAHSGEIILCPVGPLTNIAKLLEYDAEIIHHVKELVIMGGAVDCAGNVSAYAEANIWNDPDAADMVFAADWPITLIGLDVTSQITCEAKDFHQITATAPVIGGFLEQIASFYIDFYHSIMSRHVCLLHDPAALVSVTNPSAFGYEEIPLEVIIHGEAIGATRPVDHRRPVQVAKSVDPETVRKIFLDICGQCDRIS